MPTTTTTTSTTPQPTGIHYFQCWNNEIPRVYPLIHPWPCCGLKNHPNNIFGTITYTSTQGGIAAPNGQTISYCGNVPTGTPIDVTWSIPENGKCPNDQFFTYRVNNVPVEIFFTYPCWTASEFYPSSGLFGFASSFNQNIKNNAGGCISSKSGGWKFFGGYQGSVYYGDVTRGCTINVQIKGIG
jgi:hypothetical protein